LSVSRAPVAPVLPAAVVTPTVIEEKFLTARPIFFIEYGVLY